MSSKAEAGVAFLGHGTGKTNGPVTVSIRLRSPSDGAGKIEWLGDVEAGAQPKSVSFNIHVGDWSELKVAMPADGLLGTMRLYLPANPESVDVDWIGLKRVRKKLVQNLNAGNSMRNSLTPSFKALPGLP